MNEAEAKQNEKQQVMKFLPLFEEDSIMQDSNIVTSERPRAFRISDS